MFKVVVTGATGFIGRHLCEQLLKKGLVVYGIGRNRTVLNELEKNEKFHGIVLDFDDYSSIDKVIRDRDFDCFFHLAHYGVNGADKGNYRIQLQNTMVACDIVDIANILGCKRFIFVGSVDEFEACSMPDANYIIPTHSRIYGVAKYAAEKIGKVLAQKYSMEYVSALLALTYGEGNNTNILPNVLIRNAMTNDSVQLIKGNNYFDMIYVDEAVDGIIAIAEKGRDMESYYVGHEKLTTFREIVEQINEILGLKVKLEFGKYQDQGNTIDFSKINRDKLFNDTGYRCNINLKYGIEKTYKWIEEQFVV